LSSEGESLQPGETKKGNFIEVAVSVSDTERRMNLGSKCCFGQVPNFVSEALEILHRWEAAAVECSGQATSNSIAHHALQSGGSVLDESWIGDEQSEKLAFVTEELCELSFAWFPRDYSFS
jgi:hypothetical protein